MLVVLEFTSARRRQSVIVRDEFGIKLYMKGADVAVFERLHPSQADAKVAQEGFLDSWSQQVGAAGEELLACSACSACSA